MPRKSFLIVLAAIGLGLAACTPDAATGAADSAQAPPFQPAATIQDIMNGIIDPAADDVWDSVAIISSVDGVEERRPETDEDWLNLRYRALTMFEGANLLMMGRRQIVPEGAVVLDSELEGVSDAEQIGAAIDADPAGFLTYAQALQSALMGTLTAIDARDVDGLSDSGGIIDEACEACHTAYWYPDPL